MDYVLGCGPRMLYWAELFEMNTTVEPALNFIDNDSCFFFDAEEA
jgi:hypothetical protein